MIKYITQTLLIAILLIKSAFAASEADFNKIAREYTLHPDGTIDIHYYKELKINSHMSMNNMYGETFVIYNPKYQAIKINKSYTRQANGNIINTPANAFNDVLPAAAANAAAYNQLKELVITHTGLELGATIFLDYTLTTKPGYLDALDIDDILQEASPVKEYTVVINIPATETLNYGVTGINAKPNISNHGNMKQYKWTLRNIPQANSEKWTPENNNGVPRLTATTYSTQQDALKKLNNNLRTITDENGIQFTIELVKGEKTEIDRILRIQDYVVNEMSTCPLSLEHTAYQMRAPYNILTSVYGTQAEKVRVMIAMLKAININPDIVVTYPGTLNKIQKGLKPIKDIKVKVAVQGRPLFLSVTSRPSKSIALRGDRDEIWLMNENLITPLLITPEKEYINYYCGMKIDKNKITATGNFILSYNLIPAENSKNTERYIKKLLPSSLKVFKSQVMEENEGLRINFSAEQTPEIKNGYMVYSLPEDSEGMESWNMEILNSKRNNLFEIPYPVNEIYKYDIEIVPELTLKTGDKEITIQNSVGTVKISFKKKDKYLQISREIQLNKAIITPAEYPGLRKLILAWYNPSYKNIILSVNPENKQ